MDIFKFLKRKAVDFSTGLFWNNGSTIGYENKSSSDFLRYNEVSLYVNRALDIRAEKVGEVSFVLKKGDSVISDNPYLNLLNKPNNFHTGKQFWKLYQKYYDICGEVYIFKESPTPELFESKELLPTALHLLRPDLVKKVYNENNTKIVGFDYTTNGGTTRYTTDQVIYSFNPNPMSPTEGASILMAGVRAIETELQIAEYQNKILKNGGQVDSVFTFKGNLGKEQITEMKNAWQKEHAGANNAGAPLFLGGEADIKRLGLNPNELSFLTSKGVTLEDICILTGVPKEILGTTSNTTYANADASIAIFLRERIKPMLQELTTLLDWRLIPADMDLDFEDPTPEDHERKLRTAETLNTINALSTNEKREMFGLDKVKGGDDILIPFSLSPLGWDTSNSDETAQKTLKNDGEGEGKGYNHPLKDKMLRKKYAELQVKRMNKHEATFARVMKEYFKDQGKHIISSIEGRRQFKVKSLLDEVFDKDSEVRKIKDKITPVFREILIESGASAYRMATEKAYKYAISQALEHWLGERASLFAQKINDTTFERLQNQFTSSFEAGETRQQLIDRIMNTYSDFNAVRATLVARTEVHGAVTNATIDAYKQAGIATKIWVAVMDENTRDSHAEVDGEERDITMPFSNGLMWPADPNAPAEETINCRCVI